MADLSLLLARGAGRFARDPRFDGAGAEVTLAEAAPLLIDPLAEAYATGFDAGFSAGRAEALAQAAASLATCDKFTVTFARLDADHAASLHQRLLDIVGGLCEATLAPLSLDLPTLSRRIERAVAMFARADDERIIRLHPDDLAAVRHMLPTDWNVLADAGLERGGLRVETPTGGAEDGPAQWRQAIAEALGRC